MEVYVLKISCDLGIPGVNGNVVCKAHFTAACVSLAIPNLKRAVGLLLLGLEISLKALPFQGSVPWERWRHVFEMIAFKPQ